MPHRESERGGPGGGPRTAVAAEEGGQRASEVDHDLLAREAVEGADVDAGDHLAQVGDRLGRGGVAGVGAHAVRIEVRLDGRDPPGIGLGEAGMQPDRRRLADLGPGQRGGHLVALCLALGEAGAQPRAAAAVLDFVQYARDPPLQLGELAREGRRARRVRSLPRGPGLVIGPDIGADRLGMQEPVPQSGEHAAFDVGALDAAVVAAGRGSMRAPGGADEPAAAVEGGHGRPAFSAADQAREQARRRGPPMQRGGRSGRLEAGLDGAPGVVADDPQVRNRRALPFCRRARTREASAGRAVLGHGDPVPDLLAGVERLAQDAVAPLARAGDGRGGPATAGGRGDAAGVQLGADGAQALASGVAVEDLAHDHGLGRHDVDRAARLRAIGVDPCAGGEPGLGVVAHAAPRLR
nr:hypothetical protein [Phenylobacterium sp.]